MPHGSGANRPARRAADCHFRTIRPRAQSGLDWPGFIGGGAMDSGRMRAMVLSAGFGTRMGDLTREIPKPMLPLHGRPILEWILAHLARHGFREVAVNLHFRPEIIRHHFGDGGKVGLTITYSEEPQLLGTAGGVKKMESFLRQSDPFLAHYGDVVTDQDFSAMLAFHREKNALATLLLHQRAKSNSIVSLDAQQRIVGFLERPSEEARRGVQSPWVNSGICLCA